MIAFCIGAAIYAGVASSESALLTAELGIPWPWRNLPAWQDYVLCLLLHGGLGICVSIALTTVWRMVVYNRGVLRHQHARCPHCGYPIGRSSHCVECGSNVHLIPEDPLVET